MFQYLCVDFFQINKLHQMSLQQGIPIIPTSQPLLPSKYKNTTVKYWISRSYNFKHFILLGNSLFAFNFSSGANRIGSVMVSMLASSVVGRGFEPWGCQTDYKNGSLLSTLCWRSKCKSWCSWLAKIKKKFIVLQILSSLCTFGITRSLYFLFSEEFHCVTIWKSLFNFQTTNKSIILHLIVLQ